MKYADATASLPALSYLGGPRHARSKLGKRHPLPAILTVAVAAVLARAESYTAIAEWGGRLTQAQLKRTRARFDPKTKRYGAPTEPTIRRALQGADGHAPGAAIDAWLPVRRALKRLRRLLQEVDIAGKVATTDPLHTQRETAPFLVEEKKPSISSPPSKAINENSAMLLSTRTSPKSAPKTA